MTNIKGYVWIVGTHGLIMKRNPNITSVNKDRVDLPKEFRLYPNYPNPFNPSTTIKYSKPVDPATAGRRIVSGQWETTPRVSLSRQGGISTLKVYDILGREVATLVNEEISPGNYEVKFDGTGLSSGLYFYTLRAGGFTQSKKMVFLK